MTQINADDQQRKHLKQMQDKDPIVAEVKAFVKKRKSLPRYFPGNTISIGLWSYTDALDLLVLQSIIPDTMVTRCLKDIHGLAWSGLPGVNKMMLEVKINGVWPTLDRDVKKLIKNYKVCDQLREQVPKPMTPLQPIIARGVFGHVMADLIAFLIPTFGFKYILIFKDVFSGYIKCYKLRNKTTDGVVRVFEDLVCSLGPPKLLSSDNGEFISESLK